MNGKWFVRAVVTAVLATSAAAQMRQPCTGVVRDADGNALANALVVADWQPDEVVLGTPDRHETRTDADGKFAFELWIGHEYCTWVIGPADADKSRLVVPPRWCAVGGKQLELVARVRTSTVRLDVRGTTPWLPDGPLGLRVFVASGAALPDFPIPGDGLVALPPLPTTCFAVALVDGRGQVLDHVDTDAAARAECTFAAATEATFEVIDETGQPASGATIHTTGWVRQPGPGPCNPWGGQTHTRSVATTDANGRARARFVQRGGAHEQVTFVAVGRDRTGISKPAGWFQGNRFQNGAPVAAEGDDALHFVLQQTIDKTVQIVNGGAFAWHAAFQVNLPWRTHGGGGVAPLPSPGVAKAIDTWTALVPDSRSPARLNGIGAEAMPHHVVVVTANDRVDASQLRTITVQVQDAAGTKMPFARFAAFQNVADWSPWTIHVITDADGRAKVTLPIESTHKMLAFAFTDTALGWQHVGADAEVLTVRVEPFATVRIRVLDADDRPVAGAYLSTQLGNSIGIGGAVEQAATRLACAVSGAVTGSDGAVEVMVAQPHLRRHCVVAHWRGKSSERVALDERAELVLRLTK